MPARWSLRENLSEAGLSRKDRDAIVESLWLDRDQDRTPSPILQDILRPEFYTTASDRWSAPLAPSAEEDNASKGDNWREIANWKRKLREANLPILEGDTHIVPVMVNDADNCTRICQFLLNEHQIYVQPINYPTVPKGTERLRLTPGPFHSDRMIDDLVDALQLAFRHVETEISQLAG